MLLRLKAGRVYDPASGVDGEVRDLYVRDGRIVAGPDPDRRVDHEYDLTGRVVMAGAIDLHTHIGRPGVITPPMIVSDLAMSRFGGAMPSAQAWIAAKSGLTPAIFMTRVRL